MADTVDPSRPPSKKGPDAEPSQIVGAVFAVLAAIEVAVVALVRIVAIVAIVALTRPSGRATSTELTDASQALTFAQFRADILRLSWQVHGKENFSSGAECALVVPPQRPTALAMC